MAIHALNTVLPVVQVGLGAPPIPRTHGHGGHPITWTALVDTGATITAVSPAVKSALNPSPFGKVLYQPRGQRATWVDTYLITLEIEPHGHPGRTFSLEVIEEQPATPGVEILLGTDLLTKVIMVSDGPGRRFILTY